MSVPRPDPFDRPLDTLLERLRVQGISYGSDPEQIDRWITSCLICGNRTMLFEPYVGGPVTIRCVDACDEARIVAALAVEPHGHDEGLDLAEQATVIARRALGLVEASCR
jgi:hypothetical protein